MLSEIPLVLRTSIAIIIMVLFYDIAFILFSLLYLPCLFFKAKAHKGLWRRLKLPDTCDFKESPVWIHAVSVGEVQVASLWVKAIRQKSNKRLVVSTVTKTGNNLAHKLMGNETTVIYAPLDISIITEKFVKVINPSLFIMIETELWPNIIYSLYKKGVPIALLNGRISPRSFYGYSRIKFLTRGILNKISLFCMQTEEDRQRIINLGASVDKVRVTGNMKFDGMDYADYKKDGADYKIKLGLGSDDKIWVAGSTHPQEEEIILKAYQRLNSESPALKLLIAPRHIERAKEVAGLINKFGFNPVRVSQLNRSMPPSDGTPSKAVAGQPANRPTVLILDTIGQLRDIYRIATFVFVGGSLVKKGGQNILEPAAFAKPIIFGPHMVNFFQISSLYLSRGAAIEVKDAEELEGAARRILRDFEYAQELGARAQKIIFENRGATARNLELIGSLC
ncbi:MAG: 3-deoxy-D-manno-octulosonic acid transferase [Candidatus Omnitrophota bacterium]|nr:3-deoxy-D-manno-octulosonic acid transferase [Candidatus Omnitrophota bacterium]